jgi:hypothetical protein
VQLMVLGRMDTFVLLQVLRSLECLAANLTGMGFEGSVYWDRQPSKAVHSAAVTTHLASDW